MDVNKNATYMDSNADETMDANLENYPSGNVT